MLDSGIDVESLSVDQLLAQVSPTTFGKDGIAGIQFHARFIGAFLLTICRDPHFPGDHALDTAVIRE